MSNSIIYVDAEDWLDESGDLPIEGPLELYRNALRMAQCIEYAGPSAKGHVTVTLIPCRRRPGGAVCRGTLVVVKTLEDENHVFCPVCRQDEFLISNWQSTLWADGPPLPVPVEEESSPGPEVLPDGVSRMLRSALSSVGSSLGVEDVLRLISTTDSPGNVLQAVLQQNTPRDVRGAQRVADALTAAWNATPRAELGGRTPEEVYRESRPGKPASASTKVGRNEPCPCGSGKKYKKCHGAH